MEPARTETERTEPGSWREIIARFEHELGDVVDTGDADAAASEHEPPSAPRDAPPAGGTEAAHAPRGAGPQPEEGEEDALPWEFEAMTTPDYVPHRPIHDPGGREWPVDAEDGAAIEPWPGPDEPAPDDADAVDELLLDDAVPVDPWDVEAEPDDGEPASEFPLDAFIVPDNVRSVPTGYDEGDVAHRVALRLDELAEELRSGGLNALGATQSTDELSRVLAAIVTGYVAREG